MVSVAGKSLIPISFDVFQKFMNSVVPADKLPEFNIKLDGRANVKSMFAKLAGKDLTVYTGAIVNLGVQKFPDVADPESLIMLFTIYGVKKAGRGEDFDIKATDAGIAAVKCDADFQVLAKNLHCFMNRFSPLNAQAISVPSMFEAPVEAVAETAVVPTQAIPESVAETPVSTVSIVSEPAESVKENVKSKKTPVSPFKDVPLGDTPKIFVPDDLDLKAV